MKWWHVLIVIGLIGGGYFLYIYLSAPVAGKKVEDMGREHVSHEKVLATTYNSNPPTSGPHLETWVKAGVFDAPQSEGELIHSLEHGYVIISYNCNVHLKSQKSKVKSQNFISKVNSILPSVQAHEEGESSSSAQASTSATLTLPPEATGSAVSESDGCKTLVKNLTELANRKRLWKLIVVPRPQLDTTIALTAWNYIDKFDAFNAKRIERFIDYHRDQGPEKTME